MVSRPLVVRENLRVLFRVASFRFVDTSTGKKFRRLDLTNGPSGKPYFSRKGAKHRQVLRGFKSLSLRSLRLCESMAWIEKAALAIVFQKAQTTFPHGVADTNPITTRFSSHVRGLWLAFRSRHCLITRRCTLVQDVTLRTVVAKSTSCVSSNLE